MAVELKIPALGESVTEIVVGKWYKVEGDAVEQDEQLVELESEKATLDLRAPAAGTLTKILKNTGDAAEVGEVIGRLDESGDGKPAKAERGREGETGTRGDVSDKSLPSEVRAVSVAASPARDGAKQPVPGSERESKRERKQPDKVASKSPPLPVSPSPSRARDEDRVPMSPVRRRIAQRLVEAQQHAALLTTFNEIDMSAVKELRARHGEGFQRRHGVRLGFMSFFVKATIDALRQVPELNAIIDGDEIVYRRYYDIGVAISADKGLVVPVLRNADAMSFAEIEKTIEDLATRARDGKLKVEELQGGTFTITNGGVFGSLLSTPIVNPPQSGVLGMHAMLDRPVAIDNQIVIRPMMYVALTYDHRIVDGREAVTFLRRTKEAIEAPARLLIEV